MTESKSSKSSLSSKSEATARIGLGALAVATFVLAAVEDHEAIGVAFVGATIAFGLGAAFFDRIIKLSTTGVTLEHQIRDAAWREAPDATPEERAALEAEGTEVFVEARSMGEMINPELAVKEAKLSMIQRGIDNQANFANWLLERGWQIPQIGGILRPGPDLLATKDRRRVAVEVKVGARRVGSDFVRQAIAQAEFAEDGVDGKADPVLVLADIELSRAAAELAEREGIAVYAVGESHRDIEHLAGPELD